ncbi:zinc finger protein 501-like [Phlebotomus papatasi]|uniref:zinc finger protein 501-like n=1 Tax=Phlebotomus papatasi TaxID=29031 RepID=UPI0024833C58|nr:zinc finger protein 501-like [Phlebotomus papatasi]
MSSLSRKINEKCQICESTQHLVDTWTEEFGHLQGKLQAVTNSENIHNNWLRFICGSCKNKLESLWEFKILCKNAYRKYLDELDEDNCDFNSFEAYESEDAFKDNDLDSKNIITKLESEEDNRMHSQTFEMVLVTAGSSEEAKDSSKKSRKDDAKKRKTYKMRKTRDAKKNDNDKDKNEIPVKRKRGRPRKEKPPKEPKVDHRQYFPILPGPYFCGHCNKSFIAKQNIRQHVNSVHRKFLNFLCNACGRKFSNSQRLRIHENVHLENRVRVPCSICKETFISQHTLKKHMKLVHQDVTHKELHHYFRCRICNVATEGRNAHYEHLKMHPEMTIFKCRFCREQLNSLEAYAQHESIHFVERPFVCEICSKSFKQNAHLIRHRNIHTLAKKYPCNFCGKIFTQAGNRKIHMRVHTGETPYECSSCLKRFTERKMWKNHCMNCPQLRSNPINLV